MAVSWCLLKALKWNSLFILIIIIIIIIIIIVIIIIIIIIIMIMIIIIINKDLVLMHRQAKINDKTDVSVPSWCHCQGEIKNYELNRFARFKSIYKISLKQYMLIYCYCYCCKLCNFLFLLDNGVIKTPKRRFLLIGNNNNINNNNNSNSYNNKKINNNLECYCGILLVIILYSFETFPLLSYFGLNTVYREFTC